MPILIDNIVPLLFGGVISIILITWISDKNNSNNRCNNKKSTSMSMVASGTNIPDYRKDDGGEDAYFINRTSLGVADGVGGWRNTEGANAKLYAEKLMMYASLTSHLTPLQSLQYAYKSVNDVIGSSTACVIKIVGNKLIFSNLGDSGFLLINSQNQMVYKTKAQQHSFNYPYQLGTGSDIQPHHSTTGEIQLYKGDIIIVGTDGLFDNLYDMDIVRIVNKYKYESTKIISEILAEKAVEYSKNQDYLSPFSKLAQENGQNIIGGKIDDVTVIVAKVI